MALIDYDSSSSAASESEGRGKAVSQPAAKRRKVVDGAGAASAAPTGASSAMPPLPSAFYDLYASTVRQSNTDDPSLHQGRKRQIPHIVGNWPSHLYIEWFPSAAQHDVLARLLKQVEADVGADIKLHSFLTSDLGAHLPLHISLSRPITFTTAEKDLFLENVTEAVRAAGTGAFSVKPRGLAWWHSPDSERTFLILRVSSRVGRPNTAVAPNPELSGLLTRCNAVVGRFGQPPLYQESARDPVGDAFHVSIAWTLDRPSEEACLRAIESFRRPEFRDARAWDIEVAGVKAKIGNVVSHIALAEPGADGALKKSSLFSR